MNNETETFVEACERRVSETTLGPWSVRDDCCVISDEYASGVDTVAQCLSEDDAVFVANARSDLPEALRIIREQNAELAAMRKEWLGNISDIAKELAAFGFVDESGGDGIVIAVRNALAGLSKPPTIQKCCNCFVGMSDDLATCPNCGASQE
jgi:hypothetical protein